MTREERMERWLQVTEEREIGEVGPTERGLVMFSDDGGGDRRTIVLVGCGKAKQAGVHEARDLYTSNFFLMKRRYAESVGDEWYILSAKEGLTDPDGLVACYDMTMGDVDSREWGARVLDQLPDVTGDEVIVLAGPDYANPIVGGIEEQGASEVRVPTEGMEIWERMEWLAENTPG